MPSTSSSLSVVLPRAGESWDLFTARLEQACADKRHKLVLFVLPPRDAELAGDSSLRTKVLKKCASLNRKVRLAAKQPVVVDEARRLGIKVIDRLGPLRDLVADHPQLDEIIRLFSPHTWRQEIKTRLQRIGLLSLPTVRIYALATVSIFLFTFIALKLLPSSEVTIWPRREALTNTVNVFLSSTGALATLPPKVHTLELIPLKVVIHRSIVFDDISKEFIGTSAKLPMTVTNKSTEEYGLKKGTRFVNQAGMVFTLDRTVTVGPGSGATVPATAADLDMYRQIIGDRGNVPTGLKWEIPGLSEADRALVYGTNADAGKGGTTAYRTVLSQQDIDTARKRLEQELLTAAKDAVEAERMARDAALPEADLQILSYEELSRIFYSNFVLPTEQLGQAVPSIEVSGDIAFKMFAYDSAELLSMLSQEVEQHVRGDKQLLDASLSKDNMDVRVIAYDDDFKWIKLTVELTGTQQYVLDPLSVNGALFAKRVRERISGVSLDEALRIVRNMPEVDRAEIRLWPPWNSTLPELPANIVITPRDL